MRGVGAGPEQGANAPGGAYLLKSSKDIQKEPSSRSTPEACNPSIEKFKEVDDTVKLG